MKYKTNIPALFLALLVGISTNGIAVFEHICNTARTHQFSIFSRPACEMEKQVPPCCAKIIFKKKKGCCDHKQFFSKLSIEGFTAKQFQLKPIEHTSLQHFYSNEFFHFSRINFENYYSGLPPPGNLHTIQALLQPTSSGLQTFRC